MKKRILIAILAMSLVLMTGCSAISDRVGSSSSSSSSSETSFKIVRNAHIDPASTLKHIEINLGVDEEMPILLKLQDGDTVSGLFYLENGDDVDFTISDSSVFYTAPANSTGIVTSGDFEFTADNNQGIAYTLNFHNPAIGKSSKTVKVFLELEYPDTASVFVPIETK